MQRLFLIFSLLLSITSISLSQNLEEDFKRTYGFWQKAMATKDFRIWDSITSSERKKEIRNKIYSEKFSYPQEIFAIPFVPPPLEDLKLLQVKASGSWGKAVFFGKIDFGVGGKPTDNLMVVSLVKQQAHWRFAGAEYINLSALPVVRSAILKGDFSYLKGKDFLPAPIPVKNTVSLSGPVPIIAKVYAYCPGRAVKAIVNGKSNHLFQNTKQAEVVIGGVRKGRNEIQFRVNELPGGLGNEPLTVRVYAMSKVKGLMPVKAFEYLVKEKEIPKSVQTVSFEINDETFSKLTRR